MAGNLTDEPLTEAEIDLATMAQMAKHGSPFFQRLGVALGFASFPEMEAIKAAFPQVWTTYREIAIRAEGRAEG